MSSSITTSVSERIRSILNSLFKNPKQTATTILTTSTLAILTFVLFDYRAWLALGTGGTPPTWAGYWRMTKLRFNHFLSGDDMADASPLSASTPRFLPDNFSVKKRVGPRPGIYARAMPQRQYQYAEDEVDGGVREKVAELVKDLAGKYPDLLVLAPSKTEGGSTDAIYVKKSLDTLNPIVLEPRNKLLDGEIAHAHPAEGSLHVWLSQADARAVVEGGWGLRFPLKFVDKGWTMVYAPRTNEEFAVVEDIVKAGIGWLAGVRV